MFHAVSSLCLPELSNYKTSTIRYPLLCRGYFSVLTNIDLFVSIATRRHACV